MLRDVTGVRGLHGDANELKRQVNVKKTYRGVDMAPRKRAHPAAAAVTDSTTQQLRHGFNYVVSSRLELPKPTLRKEQRNS